MKFTSFVLLVGKKNSHKAIYSWHSPNDTNRDWKSVSCAHKRHPQGYWEWPLQRPITIPPVGWECCLCSSTMICDKLQEGLEFCCFCENNRFMQHKNGFLNICAKLTFSDVTGGPFNCTVLFEWLKEVIRGFTGIKKHLLWKRRGQ